MKNSAPRMSAMITSAIRHLREVQGSTAKEIVRYVTSQYNIDPSTQKQVLSVLQRAIDYGILKKRRGHYYLYSDCARQPSGATNKRRRKQSSKRLVNSKKRRKVKKERRGKSGSRSRSKSRDRARGRRKGLNSKEGGGGGGGGGGGKCNCKDETKKRDRDADARASEEQEEEDEGSKDIVCCFEKKSTDHGDNESHDDSSTQSGSSVGSCQEKLSKDQQMEG